MHRESVSIIVQQAVTIHIFIIFSANRSACFGWYPHPSSGAHLNCNYNIWHWSNRLLTWKCQNSVLNAPRQQTVADTVWPVPDAVITVWMCSWWWVRVSSETCRAVCKKYNRTVYSRMLLDNYWHRFKNNFLFGQNDYPASYCHFSSHSLTPTERYIIVL